eukprot:TRINITY_DN142_c0_g1_i3.p1 TRINITY_DN142_c0_g1~~TRINITY_DN142_c0_g1_i3.p1  ORF type:complete len:408 (+),score=94.79 TRINITY_DN142_c0_g1_i3:305-1528(+)
MGAEIARVVEELGLPLAGAVNVYRQQAEQPFPAPGIELYAADHPMPNEEGVRGVKRMIRLLRDADEKTLVIATISGGGSALMGVPADDSISLADYCHTCALLLSVPAAIDEVNCVRKHIDLTKGGRFRKCAPNAGAFVTLAVSDVPVCSSGLSDDPSVIASGPTIGDNSTFADAKAVLTKFHIWDSCPASVRAYLERNQGVVGTTNETLRPDSCLLRSDISQYVMMSNNDQAMRCAADVARSLGYDAELVPQKIDGEVTQVAERLWKATSEWVQQHANSKAAPSIAWVCFSTDGVDGNSGCAGAVVTTHTVSDGAANELYLQDYVQRHDTGTFFEALGVGLQTGPTGTNVADVAVVLLASADGNEKKALVYGGEATVQLPGLHSRGRGGRNTHLAALGALKLATLNS